MAVAYDAASEVHNYATPDPLTVSHTPVGTPRAVVVYVHHRTGDDAWNAAQGDVTYGASTMDKIGGTRDTAGEPGSVSAFFLGASVPTGAQTVSWDHAGSTGRHSIVVITYTASADCEVSAWSTTSGDQANPQIALDAGGKTAARSFAIHSGLPAVTDLTLISGMSAVHDDDVGNNVFRCDRETSTSSGSTTVGYTAASDDTAMIALAVAEAGTVDAADLAWYLSVKTGSAGDSTAGTAAGSLGKYRSTTKVTDDTANNAYDDVSSAENAAEESNYTCLFIANDDTAGSISGIYIWVAAEEVNAPLHEISIDTTGVTDHDSASAQAKEVADESTAPTSQTFTAPTSLAEAQALQGSGITLGAQQNQAIWVKRTTQNQGNGTMFVDLRFEGTP